MEARRSRSSHKVSMTIEEDEATVTHRMMQFADECIETKTVTTTTTTKRSYPPIFLREPRDVRSLDSKEYPLASKPTPPELQRLTFEIDDFQTVGWDEDEEEDDILDSQVSTAGGIIGFVHSPAHTTAQLQARRSQSTDYVRDIKVEPGIESPMAAASQTPVPPPELLQPRRSRRSIIRAVSPIHTPMLTRSSRLAAAKPALIAYAQPDKLRRAATRGSRREAEKAIRRPSGLFTTPDNSELAISRSTNMRPFPTDSFDTGVSQSTAVYDAASPTGDDSQAAFSNVATPPITDTDLRPFEATDDPLSIGRSPASRRSINAVAAQDVSLPSPRLSPTLAAAQLQSHADDDADDYETSFSTQLVRSRQNWADETQITEDSHDGAGPMDLSPVHYENSISRSRSGRPRYVDPATMLNTFDAMPDKLKTWMMFQFLRRCSRNTLHVVADVVNPALKTDFLKQLPLELSWHVLSYLDHRDLCRAAQVSKHWRRIVDGNERGWKELFDRDGFVLAPGELERAIKEGWGWQDPYGPYEYERDLTKPDRMTASESELMQSVVKSEKIEPAPKTRAAKRKRALTSLNERAAKRRAGVDGKVDGKNSQTAKMLKFEGPISAANAAALAVPDPGIGLPSLRQLHLFKSLYRRHYLIRRSWMSGDAKPRHIALAAHPRHVITCLQFDDDKIITGSDDTLIHVYDTKTGQLRKRLEGHEGGVWALQYEGNTLVSAGTDRSVRVWDIQKGQCTHTFYGHTSTVRCLQILMPSDTGKVDADGKPIMMPPKPLIITGSRDSQLRIWRLPEPGSRRYIQTGPPPNDEQCPYFIRILSGHNHSVRAIAAHGDTLVSGSYDTTVRVWRISTGELLHTLVGHNQKVYSVVLDHRRNRCISGSMDSTVKIWDLNKGEMLYNLEGHSMLVGLLDLREGRLVSAAADSSLRIWDPETGKCKKVLDAHTGAITCFQHDGSKVISGSEKTVKLWDIETGDCVQDLLTDLNSVWQVKFDWRRCVAAVQRGNLTYLEILDFGAARDGYKPDELGHRILLNQDEVQRLVEEES
ncbi:uncharacterized protein CTHT_0064130 [Thermochaetoides thermophila DSM 1495]|uniref:F-box domain-containing protein n=1 Tax=Chaetomium thermophilum (strain DSM 1495 / CBS 144.50 / IMI 039719) TaxID=759272 RepID=G0SEL1_CHATD|nr:hypothetical protein CTHT_0064130 [Thermochaetoides thermophila DSM 1495]EGS18388.1 hypothetical protein CTHT_0064130 [Thermochaetoides thermophila DSM 1495]